MFTRYLMFTKYNSFNKSTIINNQQTEVEIKINESNEIQLKNEIKNNELNQIVIHQANEINQFVYPVITGPFPIFIQVEYSGRFSYIINLLIKLYLRISYNEYLVMQLENQTTYDELIMQI
jgi:hypothetical protein